ncbi:phenylacetate--CoA ligase family protein [Thermophilibacter sp.]|uniref:phenylacetate--CoA ligase family protein n=1 Tax=Thermophilibacter sp. TaxID=2847309 RepID=UPI003A8F4946
MYETELQRLTELRETGLFSGRFYAERLISADGGDPLTSYERFRRIPFMTKDQIRRASVEERTATAPEDVYGVFSSSGTTGRRTMYVYSRNDKNVHERFVRTFLAEIGVTARDLGAVMAPIGTGVMAHTMMWEFTTMGAGYVNCPEPSPENMLETVEDVPVSVVATRPDVVSAACYRPELRERFAASGVRLLLLGGGFLTEGRRALLERVWGARCYSLFGMSEVFGPMAAECQRRDGLHYLDDYLLIEVLDPLTHEPVGDGEVGVAVYTTLWDKGFPLLRYWTDDYVSVTHESCGCRLDLPRMRFFGRRADGLFPSPRHRDQPIVFPKQIEETLFSHGLVGEYLCDVRDESLVVRSERCDLAEADSRAAEAELSELCALPVSVKLVDPGTLGRHAGLRRIRRGGRQ